MVLAAPSFGAAVTTLADSALSPSSFHHSGLATPAHCSDRSMSKATAVTSAAALRAHRVALLGLEVPLCGLHAVPRDVEHCTEVGMFFNLQLDTHYRDMRDERDGYRRLDEEGQKESEGFLRAELPKRGMS